MGKINKSPQQPFRNKSRIGTQYQLMRQINGASVRNIMDQTGCSRSRIRAAVSEIRHKIGSDFVITHSIIGSTDDTRYEILEFIEQKSTDRSVLQSFQKSSVHDMKNVDLQVGDRQAPLTERDRRVSWFDLFCENNLTDSGILGDFLIFDQVSYSQKSHLLNTMLRNKIDRFKYETLRGEIHKSDPIGLLEICPNWLLEMDLELVKLNPRVSHVFEKAGFKNLKAVSNKTVPELLMLENFGRTSVRRFFDDIEKAVTSGMASEDAEKQCWFHLFCSQNPEYLSELNRFGIQNLEMYSQKFQLLRVELIDLIDSFKFKTLINQIDVHDHIALLSICPDWLLDLDLEYFSGSVRTKNALKSIELQSLRPLLTLKKSELLKLPNFGLTSMRSLATDISNTFSKGRLPTSNDLRDDRTTLLTEFEKSLGSLNDERQKIIIERRLGYYGSSETLEEISKDYGITRERVRQIESKSMKKMIDSGYWNLILSLKLQNLIETNTAIYLEELCKNDEWFSEFGEQIHLLKAIIENFCNFELYLFRVGDGLVASVVHFDQWCQLVRGILDSLDGPSDINLTIDDIDLILESELSRYGAVYLKEPLFEAVSEHLNFSSVDSDIILSSIGNSISSRLSTVLSESETPQHYSIIRDLYQERFGAKKSVRNIHAALNHSKFLMFARGTFGAERHLPVGLEELESFARLAVSVVEGNKKRQWTTSEILNEIRKIRDVSIPEGFDKYILNIGLKKFTELLDLGRLVWMSNSEENVSVSRLLITEEIPKIIRDNGSPMATNQISVVLQKKRGTNVDLTQYLNQTPLVAKVAPGVWGLLSRDFGGTDNYWEEVLLELRSLLKNRNSALHKSELQDFITTLKISPKPTVNFLLGVASKSDFLRTWRGGFIGLASELEPNRLTISEALVKALEYMPDNFKIQDLRRQVASYINYKYADTVIPKLLNERGYLYNEADRIWTRGY